MLRDWDDIVARFDRLLPRPYEHVIREQLSIIDDTLAGFIRGQLNVCLLMSIVYGLGLTLVGLKFGIIIGLAAGLLVIVPYVGFLICFLIGMGVAFFQFDSMQDVGMVLAVFVAGQIIESNFVTPKLVGEKVGLHPVWIIFGMLAGASLFGFVGVLLAVPLTAVAGVLIRFATARYLESSYYNGEPKKAKPKT
jgi:predicted PurR-regulated permease PerM